MKVPDPEFKPIHLYVAAVSAAGLALLAVVIGGTAGLGGIGRGPSVYWFVAICVLLGELLPIRMPRRGEVETITISTAFSFALLLTSGVGVAIVAQAIASGIGDLWARRPLWRAGFNAAQYTLSLGLSAAVLSLLTDVPHKSAPHFEPIDMPAIIFAAVVYFFVNRSLVQGAGALSSGTPVITTLRRDFIFHASITGVMLALSPIVVVAAERNVAMALLVTLPIAAVYKSAKASVENKKLAVNLQEQADENEYQALHDALTGLPNRTLFYDRVQQAILSARRDGSFLALMIMDLDRFKEINDALGHHNGDLLLREIGGRLQRALRENDTIARLGGDEFAILLPKLPHPAAATNAAEKITAALDELFMLEGLTLSIGGSLGIAFFPEHGQDADTLMQRADIAMYVAKAAHTGYELYATEQDQYSPRRLALVGELRRAIDQEELLLHYQPKIDLATGHVVGVEALVRWQHPLHDLVPPDDFISLAEHTGLIKLLTAFVLNRALQQCSDWQRAGLGVGVAVNLSAHNLLDHQLPDEIAGLLTKWGVSPAWLELEITEGSIMADPVRAMSVLTRLSDMGVRLAVDDFGTGYSSLGYLKRLPVDDIKIDKSFVMGMEADENDALIVRSIIDLGRNLRMKVVAEGVESERVLDRLRALGCDVAQGYYISRPLAPKQLIEWIREYQAKESADHLTLEA